MLVWVGLGALGILAVSPVVGSVASPRAYYVALNGANANAGTLAKPFRTIQKCALVAVAGDTCFIRRGNYRETVTPANSGRPDAPITFMPYKDEYIVINGADPVTGWRVHEGKIYRARVNWDLGEGENQVFVDRKMMIEARFPNTTLDISHPTYGRVEQGGVNGANAFLRDGELDQPEGYWEDARLWIAPTPNWIAQTGTVISSKPGAVTFTFEPLEGTFSVGKDDPYYLTGTLRELDSPGEWFLDTETRTLYLWTPDGTSPGDSQVLVKHRQLGFDLSGLSHVRLVGLNLFATSIESDTKSHHLTLDRLDAQFISHFSVIGRKIWRPATTTNGIALRGRDNVLQNSLLAYSAGNGVLMNGTGMTAFNNVVHDVNYAGTDAGAIYTEGPEDSTELEISYNTLYNSGRGLIVHRKLTASKIHHNHMFNFGIQMTDLGATYCYGTDGLGTEISYNWIHDGMSEMGYGSVGIYLDAGSSNHVVHHNVVWNVTHALNLNRPSLANKVYNNTLIGRQSGIASGQVGDMERTVVTNNIITRPVELTAEVTESNNLILDKPPQFADPADNDFTLKGQLALQDKGTRVTPYTDGFLGTAPDIGAFESGGEFWKAGSSLEESSVLPPRIIVASSTPTRTAMTPAPTRTPAAPTNYKGGSIRASPQE